MVWPVKNETKADKDNLKINKDQKVDKVKNREKTIKISSLEGGCKKTFNEGEKEQRKTSQRE